MSLHDYVKAVEIKYKGDMLLRNADDSSLRTRRLSIVDSTVIACALRLKLPILTGDIDLTHVATRLGIEVLW